MLSKILIQNVFYESSPGLPDRQLAEMAIGHPPTEQIVTVRGRGRERQMASRDFGYGRRDRRSGGAVRTGSVASALFRPARAESHAGRLPGPSVRSMERGAGN